METMSEQQFILTHIVTCYLSVPFFAEHIRQNKTKMYWDECI